MPPKSNRLGNILKQKRTQQGWTQEYIAKILEIGDDSIISRIEKGHSTPQLSRLFRIMSQYPWEQDELAELDNAVKLQLIGKKREDQYEEHEYQDIQWIIKRPLLGDSEVNEGVSIFNRLIHGDIDSSIEAGNDINGWRRIAQSFERLVRSQVLQFTYVPTDETLAREVKNKFPWLSDIRVAKLPIKQGTDEYINASIVGMELVVKLACNVLTDTNFAGKVVGLGPSITLARLMEQQIPSHTKFKGTTWISVIGERVFGYSSSNQFASYIAQGMRNKYPESYVDFLPYVSPQSRENVLNAALRNEKLEQRGDRKAVAVLRRLLDAEAIFLPVASSRAFSLDFFSLGEKPPELIRSLSRKLAAANLNHHGLALFLDKILNEDAKPIEIEEIRYPLERATYAIDLRLLPYIQGSGGKIFLLASGKHKRESVKMLVNHRLVNSLIITSEIAADLVER